MKKFSQKFIPAVALAILLAAQSAFAQVYYPPQTQQSYYGSCVSITRDLSVGTRGSEVLALQRFIVSRNYPGGGSWMLTGYYGQATRAGVINFQMDMHVPRTGILDAQTRSALASLTCGYSYQQNNQYQNNQNNQYNPWYNFNNYTYGNNYNGNTCSFYGNCENVQGQCSWYTVGGQNYNTCGTTYNNNGVISISYLSPNSGAIGASVTVTGTGFTYNNNSVRFGNGIIAGLNSTDGRTLSFIVPSTLSGYGSQNVTPGVYNVSVTNGSGQTSNNLQFVVNSYNNNSNAYAPWITNVSGPTALSVNTTGTWQVSINNPSGSNNYTSISVNWGEAVYGAYMAAPQQVYGTGQQTATFTHAYSQSGTYTVTFTASNNYGSNTSSITVNVGSSNTNAPSITSITPTYGTIGTQITIYGSGFNGDNTVHFGNGGKMHVTSASPSTSSGQGGNYIYFTVPQYLSPCDVQVSGTYCAQYLQNVTPGQYQIYVTTNGVNSNSLTFTVQ